MVRLNWNDTALKIPTPGKFHNLLIAPTLDNPFGEKGRVIAGAWKQLNPDNKMDGMLILDGDVAIEPIDLTNMFRAIHNHDQMVVVAPARIWPKSTQKKVWTWAHWSKEPSQTMETENIRWFSFNFTYFPKKVIEQAIGDGLVNWKFPRCDMRMSDAAFHAGVKVFVAEDVYPKHMNY